MTRAFLRPTICALALAGVATWIVPRLAGADNSASDLSGVWQAKRNFGPDVRGPLTIERRGREWTASIGNHSASVHVNGNELSFALPEKAGSFQGRFTQESRAITGFWIQSPSVFIGNMFASPVDLRKTVSGQWCGDVVPLDDTMTLYLVNTPNPDGNLSTFLRNPERNVGLFLNPNRLVRDGDQLLLEHTDPETGPPSIVAQGGYDGANAVMSFYIPNAGGSFDFTRAGGESGFYSRGKDPALYVYHQPAQRGDGWPVSSLEDVGISRPMIESLVRTIITAKDDSVHSPAVHGILIARHGKLVLEEYFHGFSTDQPHETRSAAKTVAAILAGAAMYAHAPINLSTPVYQTYFGGNLPADLDPRKRRMTLRHLLTMSSGLDCNDWDNSTKGSEDNTQNQTQDSDWRHFTLNVPSAREPGSLSLYCAGGPNLIGGMLEKMTGKTDQELFDTLVAKQMKFGRIHMT